MDLFDKYRSKLAEAVEIKSISTDPVFKREIEKMAIWCKNELTKIGFETELIKGYGNPIVYGNLTVNPSFPTILQYGHYDVQPAEKKDGWLDDPFKLYEKNKRLYARGVVDNKGQFLIYFTVINHLLSENKLRYNIKFIIEGDEETGSGEVGKFLKDYSKKLKPDMALISDGEITNNQPTICASYRGSMNIELIIYGPKNDLHSGIYGGIVNNPINALSFVLSKLSYIDVSTELAKSIIQNPDKKDLRNLKKNTFDFKEFKKITGYDKPTVGTPEEIYAKLGFSNAVNVTGISSGYTGPGFRNAIPPQASAKINIRINPGIGERQILKELKEYIKEIVPAGTKYKLKIGDISRGVKIDTKGKYFSKAEKLLEKVYKKPVLYNYQGATIPIAYNLSDGLGTQAIFVELANADCNMHAPNENFKIDLINKGIKFAYQFLSE